MMASIKGLHEGLKAKISAEGGLSEAFEVTTGVRQGCCMAPILFSLYFAVVIKDWKSQCPHRVHLSSRIDGNLRRQFKGMEMPVHERTHIMNMELLDAEFADDLAVLAETSDKLQECVEKLLQCFTDWGLIMSSRTELLHLGQMQ